jgi:hypothetical protein
MAAFLFLGLALICVVVGRILLVSAAFGVSVWWGLSVFLPFGPLFFRLSYPELAPLSRKFRLAALPCLLGFLILQPRPITGGQFVRSAHATAAPANRYGLEKVTQTGHAANIEERRAANAHELERLAAWSEALRLKKRDLLHSDAEGNRAYEAELAQYNAALQKATAEKNSLSASAK